MMTQRWMTSAVLLATMLGLGPAVYASVDRSPGPIGVYKLKPGIYVALDADCDSPVNAQIRQYDGRGISTAHSRACKARVITRKGNRFTVNQSCIDTGTGPGRREVERQQVQVRDALTFTQTINNAATTYRYCPAYQLPPDLRRSLH